MRASACPPEHLPGFDWLKSSGCGGSAPNDYVPCTWNPRLPFNTQLETEVLYGTGVATDPVPRTGRTRLRRNPPHRAGKTNGQERLDLAAEMLHATQGSSNSIRATRQHFTLNDVGQLQVGVTGTQAPPTLFLRVDGVNDMDATLDMGGKNLVDVGDLTAEGEVEFGRFVDRDDPAFVMDPNAQSIIQELDVRGDFAATAGGNLNALSVFDAGADIESNAAFQDEAFFHGLAKFIGGETDFNATVESSGGTPAEFTVADSQDLADFHAELEIVGIGVVGGACNATIENIRFNSAGEMLECVGGLWQYAGIETRKGTITYYSLDSTNSYGEFFWAGDGIDLPGKHHVCSAQSIESSNLAEGGGARIESTSGPDQFGRRSFQYLAAAGVRDAEDIPLQLESGERTVICLALGPEPVQATVGTQSNSAPTGSVTCTAGIVGQPFVSNLSVSDPDTPLLIQWSATGACSTMGTTETQAGISRNSVGTCTIRVTVTDYYNASRTITNSCPVRPVPQRSREGVCGCSANSCSSGILDTDPEEPDPPDPPDPLPPGWTPPDPPPERWWCDGSNGGRSDFCTEGNDCPPPVINGVCRNANNNINNINKCVRGNAVAQATLRTDEQTTYRWTCNGINGGANAPCSATFTHVPPCNPVTDRVNGVCGPIYGDCNAGTPEEGTRSWLCLGECGGNDSPICTVNGPVDGACGDTTMLNSCVPGSTLQPVSGTSWICEGSNGGSDEPCTLTQPIVDGRCGTGSMTTIGDCSAGISSDPSGNTNPWECRGINGGVDVTCEFGVCNDTTTPHCDVGDFENILGGTSWRCEGNIDNTLVDNATCVIAVCGRTQGTCDEGTDNGINPWTCAGGADHGTADDVNCYVGACGTADTNPDGCTVGDWEHVDDTATDVLWDCKGSYHDPAVTADDIRCTLGLPICGPTQGTCDEGTPVGTGDDWICRGATTDINCRVGICDFGFVGDCAEGAPTSIINPLTLDTNPWTCQGSYHDPAVMTDDDDCFFGVCNDDENSAADTNPDGCMVGNWVSVSDLIGPPPTIRWTCAGSFPGETNDDDPCTQRNGACDSVDPLITGDCDAGVSNDPSGATNPWICEGTGGGTDETCTVGVCGDTDDMPNGCRAGVWQAAPDHEWTCTGNVKDTGCYHGVCDYAGPGQCVDPSTSSGLNYEWTCWGADSMSTADDVDCVKAQCKVCAQAQDNSLKGCKTGDWEHVDGPTWNCLGNHQNASYTLDDDLGCQACVPNGRCGYDFAGDCDAGISSGTGNEWKCLGPDDNVITDDDDCAIGQCPTTSAENGTCVVGDAEYLYGTTYTDGDDWKCKGSNTTGTNDDVTCSPVVDGVCGEFDNAAQGCDAGMYEHEDGDTWRCLGINGGTDAPRCREEDAVGHCGTVDHPDDGCDQGVYDDFDNGGPDWHCRGSNDTSELDDDLNCAPAACNLVDRTWIASCGQGQIGCDGYYETTYQHCIVTNPVDGALYYQDAVGYGVNFLAATPSDPVGNVTVEYTCCTNCDDLGSPITDPGNDCSWPPVTPVTPVVDGVCGTAVGDCDAGNPADVDTVAGTWTCEGTGGGTDASCPAPTTSCVAAPTTKTVTYTIQEGTLNDNGGDAHGYIQNSSIGSIASISGTDDLQLNRAACWDGTYYSFGFHYTSPGYELLTLRPQGNPTYDAGGVFDSEPVICRNPTLSNLHAAAGNCSISTLESTPTYDCTAQWDGVGQSTVTATYRQRVHELICTDQTLNNDGECRHVLRAPFSNCEWVCGGAVGGTVSYGYGVADVRLTEAGTHRLACE